VDADSLSWPIVQFELAKAFAGQGNETEAIKRVELIRNSEPNTHNLCCTVQIEGYGQIVELRAKKQLLFDDMLTAARKTLSLVSDIRAKPIVVSQMAVLLAQAGRTQEAEAILEQVPETTNASNLATGLIAITKAWLRSGDASAAARFEIFDHRSNRFISRLREKSRLRQFWPQFALPCQVLTGQIR
jgi:hypothetical protein